MKVSEAMTRDVCVARPDLSIQEAAKLMADIDAGVLPVGENDRLVGMITDRDIALRAVAPGKGPQTAVREVMTSDGAGAPERSYLGIGHGLVEAVALCHLS
jgi:CBS domain-containing protein